MFDVTLSALFIGAVVDVAAEERDTKIMLC